MAPRQEKPRIVGFLAVAVEPPWLARLIAIAMTGRAPYEQQTPRAVLSSFRAKPGMSPREFQPNFTPCGASAAWDGWEKIRTHYVEGTIPSSSRR